MLWIIIFSALCLICAIIILITDRSGGAAVISLNGEAIRRVELDENQEFDIDLGDGEFNHISVRDGKIAVTDASCPDRLCVRRGYISGGVPIICLPHRLTVEVTDGGGVDAVTGR